MRITIRYQDEDIKIDVGEIGENLSRDINTYTIFLLFQNVIMSSLMLIVLKKRKKEKEKIQRQKTTNDKNKGIQQQK